MAGAGYGNMEAQVRVEDLPMTFKVKYIGSEIARGLWGIKYTRRPVDSLVDAAKNLAPNKVLPFCELTVTLDGVSIEIILPSSYAKSWSYPIDTISYGVQDLVYTRVFAMIVVKDDNQNPFEVHAFACDNRAMTRKLTFALAAAFQDYSRRVKEDADKSNVLAPIQKKFAIDLRGPDEMQQDIEEETEA